MKIYRPAHDPQVIEVDRRPVVLTPDMEPPHQSDFPHAAITAYRKKEDSILFANDNRERVLSCGQNNLDLHVFGPEWKDCSISIYALNTNIPALMVVRRPMYELQMIEIDHRPVVLTADMVDQSAYAAIAVHRNRENSFLFVGNNIKRIVLDDGDNFNLHVFGPEWKDCSVSVHRTDRF